MNPRVGVLTARICRSLIGGGLVLSLASPLSAEEPAPLEGPRVRVVAPSVAKHDIIGQLVGQDDESFTIARANGEGAATKTLVVPRAAVTGVEVSRARSKKGKGALIGAAAGLAVGVALGFATGDSHCSGDSICVNQAGAALLSSILTVPLGILVGASVAHGEKWEPVDPRQLHVVVGPARGRGAQIRFALSF
jgi:hypothetical protein